jgi:predicted Zn-dependent peptidase
MTFATEKLPGGGGLAVSEMPQMESVTVGLWLGVGGRHESARLNGVSHFIEHMLFKGTARRTAREISEAVEGVGGYLNAFTGEEMTCYYANASARHVAVLIDVLMDMLLHASFPVAEIARERGVIIEEIRMYEDQSAQVAQEKLTSLMWPDHPLGLPLSGTVKTIDQLRRVDLLGYRRKYYHSGNLWITVAGKTNLAQVKYYLEPLLRKLPAGKAAAFRPASVAHRTPRIAFIRKPVEQTQFALGLRGISRHDPRRFSAHLLSIIMGENMSSRLFQVIREKHGLAYSVSSSTTHLADTGSFVITAGIENGKARKAVKLILLELQQIARRAPSAQEVRRAKEYAIGQMHLGLESTTSQMMWMGEDLLGHGRILDPAKVSGQIEAVTAEEIRLTAEALAVNHRLSLAVVSPEDEIKRLAEVARFK